MQLSEQSFVPLPSKEPWSLTIVSFCCTTSLLLFSITVRKGVYFTAY